MDTSQTAPIIQTGSVHTINWGKVVIAAVGLAIFGGACAYVGHEIPVRQDYTPMLSNASTTKGSATPSVTATPTSTPLPSTTPAAYTGWQTYTNSTFGYSFKYPQDWTLDASKNSIYSPQGGGTISLEHQGYYIVFTYDIPNGIGTLPEQITKTENLTIDNQNFTEAYISSCPVNQSSTTPTIATDCQNTVAVVRIINTGDSSGTTHGIVQINGKTSSLSLEFPYGVILSLSSSDLQYYNDIFTKVLASFILPTK